MTASTQYFLLENFARSTNIADFTNDGWSYSGSIGQPNVGYQANLGKTGFIYGGYSSGFNQTYVNYAIPTPCREAFVGVRFAVDRLDTSAFRFGLGNARNVGGYVAVDTAAGVAQMYDSTGLKATIYGITFVPNVPYYFELHSVCDHAAGTLEFRINEAIPAGASLTGLNTDPSSLGVFNQFQTDADSGVDRYFTDCYGFDPTISGNPSTYEGDTDVQWLPAVANGSTVQFTPNGLPENWQNVAVNPPNATIDFNISTTAGQYDEIALGNLSSLTASVQGLRAIAAAQNTSGGLHTCHLSTAGSGGSTYTDGGALNLSNVVQTMSYSPPQDGNTGAAWAVAGVSGMSLKYTLDS
jgi:hypothetical protein